METLLSVQNLNHWRKNKTAKRFFFFCINADFSWKFFHKIFLRDLKSDIHWRLWSDQPLSHMSKKRKILFTVYHQSKERKLAGLLKGCMHSISCWFYTNWNSFIDSNSWFLIYKTTLIIMSPTELGQAAWRGVRCLSTWMRSFIGQGWGQNCSKGWRVGQ